MEDSGFGCFYEYASVDGVGQMAGWLKDRQARIPRGIRARTGPLEKEGAMETHSPNIIHILGASGSGTTTLAKAISEKYRCSHIDADDCFWLPTDPAYTVKRELSQRQKLLGEAIASDHRCVISGSLCGWGDVFIPMFDLVILLEAPTEIRIERLKRREYSHFGRRILPGGDMYENHMTFLEWAAKYDTAGLEQRSRVLHAQWLKGLSCSVLSADGTRPIHETLARLESVICGSPAE